MEYSNETAPPGAHGSPLHSQLIKLVMLETLPALILLIKTFIEESELHFSDTRETLIKSIVKEKC